MYVPICLLLIIGFTGCGTINIVNSRMPKIKTSGGIATFEEITLGGVKQVISIRSADTANPVLLLLHGGPGSTLMPYAHVSDRELEKHFIVVHWDQRGAGKSFNKDMKPSELNIDQYLSDAVQLITYLTGKFNQQKVYLLGHSWGSYLGIRTAYEHPELLHAYIGMGQVINMPEAERISYNFVMKNATTSGKKKAVRELEAIGMPPYDNYKELLSQRKWLSMQGGLVANCSLLKTINYSLSSPEYSLSDHIREFKGRDFSLDAVWPNFQTQSVEESIKEFKIPVYFMEGRYDYCVPSELVERYIKNISAPHTEIIWFEHSAHLMNIEEPELYQQVLIEKVLGKEIQ